MSRKNSPFSQTKRFSFAENFLTVLESQLFLQTKKLFFCTNLSFFPPKITLFCPPSPISTSLNLLFAKNTAVLFLFALILYCKAGASHRFKSLPAISDEIAVFSIAGYLMNAGCFRKNTVSTGDLNRPRSPEVRKPLACFLVTFCTMQKVTTRFPFREVPRFCKPQISVQNNNSHNPIKSF